MKNIKIILLITFSVVLGLTYVYKKPYNDSAKKVFLNIYEDYSLETVDKFIESINEVNISIENEPDKTTENNNGKLININTADKETLKTLPNIGDVVADNIIYYRENVSKFNDISDIKKVKRIGEKTFEKIKHLITTS